MSAVILFFAPTAYAVVIAGPDGAANTTAPNPDPGFANVGVMSGLSGVYVRNGWVLTASHVGTNPIVLEGVVYDPVPGSTIRMTNPVPPDPDLIAFKLERRPPLPDLLLPTSPPALNDDLILIGNGRDRDSATTWTGSGGTQFDGWSLLSSSTMRWGANYVEDPAVATDTVSFATVFDELPGQSGNDPEAQAVTGDSGGAAFRMNGPNIELLGIIWARSTINVEQIDQPLSLVLYQNASLAADLFFYGAEIASVIDRPDCSDGLDEDGDGLTDYPNDPGCDSANDFSEWSAALVCDNGLDDDSDGLFDFPEDDGCDDLFDTSEVPEPSLLAGLALGVLALSAAGRNRTFE